MLTKFEPDLPIRSQQPFKAEEMLREIRKIAVLRANKLGDFILALPALQSLRIAYPEAEIVLLGREWHVDFLEGRPGPIDRVIAVPPVQGIYDHPHILEDAHQIERFFEDMAEEHFDVAIQVHGDGRYSNPFVRRLGARMTVGARLPDAQPLDRWIPFTYTQSEIIRHLEVVSLLGAKAEDLDPHLEITPRDLEEANRIAPLVDNKRVVLHPGGDNLRYQWPESKFAAIADDLAFNGAQVYFIGTEAEQGTVESILSKMTASAVNLCSRLSLRGLAGFLAQSRLMISNNTDYLRLAWAVGTPTVGIYWFGSLLTAAPLIRTRHRPAVSWRVSCPVCGVDSTRFSCEHQASFMDDVTVSEVLASAFDLVGPDLDWQVVK